MTAQLTQIYSPFKFLDPYGREDRAFFFGRKDEIETLHQFVNKNRLVLVYGQSGTGKTSVVQCGLANRFEVTDWVPFFIRRNNDINQSLRQALSQSKAIGASIAHDSQIIKGLEQINTRYMRPVYLIFDQFEELLILGDEEEKETFLNTLEKILQTPETQSCHLLFIMREEYFAWLEAFEERIPGFSDRRLRIEQMRPARVDEVIIKSCNHFNITLENPAVNAELIRQNLTGKTGVSLPYLQVYLDMLWREDYDRTYPNGWQGTGKYAPLEFTTQEIQDLGAFKDVLERFLNERREGIKRTLEVKHPNLDSNIVRTVLDAFVSEEGTKQPIAYTLEEGEIILSETAPDVLRQLPPNLLKDCLQELEQSRILRNDGDTFELAHDTLARLIDQQRTDEQRQLNERRRELLTYHRMFKQTGVYLNRKQLLVFEDALPKLRLDQEVLKFIEDSKKEAKKQEVRDFFRTVGRVYMYLITGLAVVAVVLAIVAARQTMLLRQEEAYKLIDDGDSLVEFTRDSEVALGEYKKALELQPTNERAKSHLEALKIQLDMEAEGDRLKENGELDLALKKYEAALDTNPVFNKRISVKKEELSQRLQNTN